MILGIQNLCLETTDKDGEDRHNSLMCTEYATDIYKYLREKEASNVQMYTITNLVHWSCTKLSNDASTPFTLIGTLLMAQNQCSTQFCSNNICMYIIKNGSE